MKTHDPTTLDRQGHDAGEQYRSIIFTHTEEQAKQAQGDEGKAERLQIFDDPIVTFIQPAVEFGRRRRPPKLLQSQSQQPLLPSSGAHKVEKLEKFFKGYEKVRALRRPRSNTCR